MDDFIIKAMVHALRPVLRGKNKAELILERFWKDKIALVWDLEDVFRSANERNLALTRKEAIHVLKELHHGHNKQYGLQWKDVTSYIEEHGLGRKLTKAELKRFLEKDILTIQRR